MASIHIKLKDHKTNKAGEAPIVLRIIHDKANTEISLQRYIKPSFWNANKEQVKSSHPSYKAVNAYLNRAKATCQSVIDKLLRDGEKFTATEVARIYKGESAPGSESIASWLREIIKQNPENLSSTTLGYYVSLVHRLDEFDLNIKFSGINESWLQRFERHLKNQGLAINTIHNRLKVLKKACKHAYRKGWIEKDPFTHFKLKTEESRREYLTTEELVAFTEYEPPQESYRLVKDAFVFACYTGLRFSDIATLRSSSIECSDSSSMQAIHKLRFRMSKTQDLITLKLPEKAVVIISKYGYPHESESRLLPILLEKDFELDEPQLKARISSRNAYFNKVLKAITAKAGIKKRISMHCARHTFATMGLTLGIPMEVMSKLLGHRDLKTTQIYGKIVSERMDEAMDLFNL